MAGHQCPAPGCPVNVPFAQYACRQHWYALPDALRREVWRAYRDDGQLSGPHIAAMEACDAFLRAEAAAA